RPAPPPDQPMPQSFVYSSRTVIAAPATRSPASLYMHDAPSIGTRQFAGISRMRPRRLRRHDPTGGQARRAQAVLVLPLHQPPRDPDVREERRTRFHRVRDGLLDAV